MLQYSLKMSVSDQICLLCLTQVSTVRHSSSLLYDILRPQICLLCLPQVSTVHSSSLLYDILRPQICLLCFPQVSTVRHSSSPNLSPLSPSSLYCTTFFVTLKEVRIMFSLFCCFIRIERHGRRQNYSIIKQIGLSIFKKLSVEQFFKL